MTELASYPYSIADDTANGAFDPTSFEAEYKADESIIVGLHHVGTDGDDITVWTKGTLPSTEETALENLLAAHQGIPTPSQPVTDEGVCYFTPLPGKSGRLLVLTGRKFDAAANDTTHDDYTLEETRELQGAMLHVANHEPGDYVELTARGDLGGGEVEVGKFAETIYIPPCGEIDPIVSESTVSFPATFKIRMTYVAVATGTTRTIYVTYRMRHDV